MKPFFAILILLASLAIAPAQIGFKDQTGSAIVPNGLVGYWSMDSIQRGVVQDLSVNGNNATNSGATTASGIIRNSANFNGSAFLSAPSSFNSQTGTISFWFKNSTYGGNQYILGKSAASGSTKGIYFYVNSTNTIVYSFQGGGSSAGAVNITNISFNQTWCHIVATFNSTNLANTYANGVANATVSPTAWSWDSSPVRFATSLDSFWAKFIGSIDDVRIYNRVLTTNEISQIYQWGWGSRQGAPVHP